MHKQKQKIYVLLRKTTNYWVATAILAFPMLELPFKIAEVKLQHNLNRGLLPFCAVLTLAWDCADLFNKRQTRSGLQQSLIMCLDTCLNMMLQPFPWGAKCWIPVIWHISAHALKCFLTQTLEILQETLGYDSSHSRFVPSSFFIYRERTDWKKVYELPSMKHINLCYFTRWTSS